MKLSDLLKQAPPLTSDGALDITALDGEATVEVMDAKYTISKAGNPMIVLDVRALDGPGKGMKSREFIVATDNPDAMPFLIEKLSALGVFKKELLEQDDWTTLAQAAVGRRARVVTEGEVYNHRLKFKVKQWIEPAGRASAGSAVSAPTTSPDWGDGGEY